MSSKIRIAVIGAGATGAFLACKLTDAGYPVTLVARGASLETIRKDGIAVTGPLGAHCIAKPDNVVSLSDTTEPVDVVLVCVKSYSTQDVAREIGKLIKNDGHVLCLQNGVANEQILSKELGEERVIAGVLYIGSQREAPGRVKVSTPARIFFGSPHASSRNLSEALKAAFDAAGIENTIEPDVLQSKWQKFLFNCGLNPLTALTGMKMGALISSPEGARLYEALIDEAIAVSAASGAPLAADARERALETARRMDISSSMAEDLVAGRPIERGAFTGFVCELGRELDVATPVTQSFDDLLALRDPGRTGRQ